MEQEKKIKSYFFSKVLIMLLSLVLLLNGLGLIVAGKRVGEKTWVIAGITYIVVEWICTITDIGVTVAFVLYFVSIIHTALICSEYGRLLNFKFNDIIESNNTEKEDVNNNPDYSIKVEKIQLNIGTAEVEGKAKEKLKIKILSEQGKIYEFDTAGNVIESFSINGKTYNYGGEYGIKRRYSEVEIQK